MAKHTRDESIQLDFVVRVIVLAHPDKHVLVKSKNFRVLCHQGRMISNTVLCMEWFDRHGLLATFSSSSTTAYVLSRSSVSEPPELENSSCSASSSESESSSEISLATSCGAGVVA